MVSFNPNNYIGLSDSNNLISESARYLRLICGSATIEEAHDTLKHPPSDLGRRQYAIDHARDLVIRYQLSELPQWISEASGSYKLEYTLFTPSVLLERLRQLETEDLNLNKEPLRDNKGLTPFHYACKWDHPDKFLLIHYLIDCGWENFVADDEGNLPFDLLQPPETDSLIPILKAIKCPAAPPVDPNEPGRAPNWLHVLCTLKNTAILLGFLEFTPGKTNPRQAEIDYELKLITRLCSRPDENSDIADYIENKDHRLIKLTLTYSYIKTLDDINLDDIKWFYDKAPSLIVDACQNPTTSVPIRDLLVFIKFSGKNEVFYDLYKNLYDQTFDHYNKIVHTQELTNSIFSLLMRLTNNIWFVNPSIRLTDPNRLIQATMPAAYLSCTNYSTLHSLLKINFLEMILPSISDQQTLLHKNHLKYSDDILNKYIISKGFTRIHPVIEGVELFSTDWIRIVSAWLNAGGKFKHLQLDDKISTLPNGLSIEDKFGAITGFISKQPAHYDYIKALLRVNTVKCGITKLHEKKFLDHPLIRNLSIYDYHFDRQSLLAFGKSVFSHFGYFTIKDVDFFHYFAPSDPKHIRRYLSEQTKQTYSKIQQIIRKQIHGQIVEFSTALKTTENKNKINTLMIEATYNGITSTGQGYFTEAGHHLFLKKFSKAMFENSHQQLSTDPVLRHVHSITWHLSGHRSDTRKQWDYEGIFHNNLPIRFSFDLSNDDDYFGVKQFNFESQKVHQFRSSLKPLTSADGLIFDLKDSIERLLTQYRKANSKQIKAFNQSLLEAIPASNGEPSRIALNNDDKEKWLQELVAEELQGQVNLTIVEENNLLGILKQDLQLAPIAALESTKNEVELALQQDLSLHQNIWQVFENTLDAPSTSAAETSQGTSRKRLWIYDHPDNNSRLKTIDQVGNNISFRPSGLETLLRKIEQDPAVIEIQNKKQRVKEADAAIYQLLIDTAVENGFVVYMNETSQYRKTIKGVLWELHEKSVIQVISKDSLSDDRSRSVETVSSSQAASSSSIHISDRS